MLHDCYVRTDARKAFVRIPTLVAELHKARKERLERFNTAAYVKPTLEPEPPVVEPTPPAPISWVERQKAIPIPEGAFVRVVADAPTVAEVVAACCAHFNISRHDLVQTTRVASIVHARHVAMYLAREISRKSFPDIARRLGGLDHTTVIHGHRKTENLLLKKDFAVCYDVAHVEAML